MKNSISSVIRRGIAMLNFYERRKEKEAFRLFCSSIKNGERFALNYTDNWYIKNEKTTVTEFDRHYVYHTGWAARYLQKTMPQVHTDISSSLFFCAIASAFCKIDFFDYRPAELILDNLSCQKADLTNLFFANNSLQSLSCMHTIEHIGLGRYGEPFDYDGDIKAIDELKRVTAPGGNLLIVVPVGGQSKIVFNAHRIYHPALLLSYFNGFKLLEFSLIPEFVRDGGITLNPSEEFVQTQDYACGCFWFKKDL